MRKRYLLTTAGIGGIALTAITSCSQYMTSESSNGPFPETIKLARKQHNKRFNMTGYAAPAIDTVKIAYIGIGNRGFGALRRMVNIAHTEIRAIADIQEAKIQKALDFLSTSSHKPDTYMGSEDAW